MSDFESADLDRIIEMAWEDRTPFEAIAYQFGLSEQEVINVMRPIDETIILPYVAQEGDRSEDQACVHESIESLSSGLSSRLMLFTTASASLSLLGFVLM